MQNKTFLERLTWSPTPNIIKIDQPTIDQNWATIWY